MSDIRNIIFDCIDKIVQSNNSKDSLDDVISAVWNIIESTKFSTFTETKKVYEEILKKLIYKDLLDSRLNAGILICALFKQLHNVYESTESIGSFDNTKTKTESFPPPSGLISIKHHKVLEDGAKILLYWPILACLDGHDAALCLKLKIAKTKWPLGGNFIILPKNNYMFLKCISEILLTIYQNKVLGSSLQKSVSPEVLSLLLYLGFDTNVMKEHPTDIQFPRQCLDNIMEMHDTHKFIEDLLLLMGILPPSGRMWKLCEHNLVTRYLMNPPNGLTDVLLAGLSMGDAQNWKYCEALATLIANRKVKNIEEFYSCMGFQINVLLLKYKEITPDSFRVLALVISKLAERSPKLIGKIIFGPVLQSLINITTNGESSHTEIDPLISVILLHKIIIEICPPSLNLSSVLRPVLWPLLKVASLPPTCPIKTNAKQMIIRYLTLQDLEIITDTLLTLSDLNPCEDIPAIKYGLSLIPDLEIGFTVKENDMVEYKLSIDDIDKQTLLITDLLQTLQNSQAVLDFVKKICQKMDFTTLTIDQNLQANSLMTEEDLNQNEILAMREITICVSMLANIGENKTLTNNLFGNLYEAVPVIESLLDASINRSTEPSVIKMQDSALLNTILLVLGYINHQMSNKGLTSSDWRGLQLLLPKLRAAEKVTKDEAVQTFIEQLKNTVLTHGVITSDFKNTADKKYETTESPIIKEESIPSQKSEESISYKQALVDITSPHLPIKGHALIQLSRLIEERDKSALDNQQKLLAIFEHHLKDDDSYIYLSSIQGLVSLCNAYPDQVIPLLLKGLKDTHRTPQDRAKLAETVTKSTKRIGDLIPKYRNMLLYGLLASIKDADDIIRTACISALGDVCSYLGWSIQPILHDTLGIFYDILLCDKCPEVRRAVVMSVTHILKGHDINAISVFQDVLRDLYRTLKRLVIAEQDEIIRIHAQLALDEIDKIMRQFLQPKLQTTKKIYITEVPPNFL